MNNAQMLAMLRHAYEQLRTPGAVEDQSRFADGLIAPVIRGLETGPNSAAWDSTADVLSYVTTLMHDVHLRHRGKDLGYTPEDEAELSALRRVAKRIGDDRYKLASKRTPAMDALMKSIHGNPRFSFENASKAIDEAVKRRAKQ